MCVVVNSLADYSAASLLQAAHTTDLRRRRSRSQGGNRRAPRRSSMDLRGSTPASPMRTSLDVQSPPCLPSVIIEKVN